MGVILCGGNSSRMGRDKGLMLREGVPWARHMADKLSPFHLPVVFSINASQVDAYSAFVPAAALVTDNVPVSGPLKGLLSVHEQFPGTDLLLLACDMLDVDGPTIGHLIASYGAGGYEFYAYQESTFFQPLCAIFTAAALERGTQEPSLQMLLRHGKTRSLAVLRSEAFRNYNSL
ncbi:molybdenum cofactor guanylyltransferase [Flavitalea sp. BT771]|uniref:molybdenum cofactor guanylyltransferase n=1 Tax=Flavitalea sp. BT771 TaxID=3063329 RepID=UPI0026E1F6C9|nr:molybdenum cofactor guanylyltransferase [Flavitalea sp. BT771]MDO6431241.1 molybdenum cofactor guanylyltransferase [Flavitalea sp. BT771]MDV6220148.1 molybdenum cofactor guanylyltransferase [Flavitalea sp. BT771]